MEKTNQRLQQLLNGYLLETITDADRNELWDYLNNPVCEGQIKDLISVSFDQQNEGLEIEEKKQQELLNYIYTQEKADSPKIIKRSLWPRMVAAASIVLVAVAGLYYYTSNKDTAQHSVYANDVGPGKNGATLTLANGRKIRLNDAVNGELSNEAGVSIRKTKDGRVYYEVASAYTTQPGNDGAVNTLSTSNGETYQVRLSDGSLVFLNAASSLKFPTSFARLKERRVEIFGEAYFEIAKDKAHPFIVKNAKQDVEVLGTHFNINAYDDEPSVKTTLLEGSIRISRDQQTKVLRPGEQAVNDNKSLIVNEVDTEKAVAWKNSKFVFDDENIESVMRKLSRWYNVEVVYQDNVTDRTFTGSISRYDKISKILDKITYIEAVHFKVEGRRITVMK